MADSPNDKKFMREKIVKPPINKRRLAGRVLCLCLFAVILGVVAAVSFVVSRPMVEKFLGRSLRPQVFPLRSSRIRIRPAGSRPAKR